jgi:hypothetical protein
MYSSIRNFILIVFLAAASPLMITGCASGHNKADTSQVFFDYTITGREGDENITAVFRFREYDEEGDAFRLNDPATISLDGEVLLPDSSKITGYYYEVQKPADQFSGQHVIIFSDGSGNDFREEFNFIPPVLITLLPETVKKDSLVLEFSGLEKEDFVRILISDTTYPGLGIDRLDTVRNGRLVISKDLISSLTPGPVLVEVIREQELPLKSRTKAGGRFRFVFMIKREFILTE